jgi:tartrate dehydrogenase/decarboxylase/D-malate dehydrogenase
MRSFMQMQILHLEIVATMPGHTMRKTYKIAAIAGDGIGKEVMPEGLRTLQVAAKRFGFGLDITHPSIGRVATTTPNTAKMMPEDWKSQLQGMDAIYFGAVGWPATVPDHISLWGVLAQVPSGI